MEMYKVLWIDDLNLDYQGNRTAYFAGAQLDAESWNIELVPVTNWNDGARELERNFNDYSAIILDAYCKLENQGTEEDIFISNALTELSRIFIRKGRELPWYIYSAGTMDGFDMQVRTAKRQHKEEWGDMLYIKTASNDSAEHSSKMYDNISRVAKDMALNIVLQKHNDIFSLLGSGRVINSDEARRLMITMLSVFYYPEEYHNYEYSGNPIRKVLEHLFRSARDYGLLPDVFFNENRIAMQRASLFMAGITVNLDGNIQAVRWGNNGDSIFPKAEATIVKNLLLYANVDSHTQEEGNNSWRIDMGKRYLFNAYLCSLCHIIKWYEEYIREHKDFDANFRNIREIEPEVGSKYNGIVCEPQIDEEGEWHYEECWLYISSWKPEWKMRLKEIQPNKNNKTKDRYPYFAKYDKLTSE